MWATAFGALEIPPERIAVSGGGVERRLDEGKPLRFRLADGTLHEGRPTLARADALVLRAPDGEPRTLVLSAVMEVNDLPRWGPGGQAPLLVTPGTTGVLSVRGAAAPGKRPAARPTAPTRPTARSTPPPPRTPTLKPRRRRLGVLPRLGQLTLGTCGFAVGASAGAALGAATGDEEAIFLGLGVGGSLGAAGVAYGIGAANDGTGTFGGSLLGALLGTAAGGLLLWAGEEKAILPAIVLPMAGSALGYALSVE